MSAILPGMSLQHIYQTPNVGGGSNLNGQAAQDASASPFTSLFNDALQTLNELNETKAEDAYAVAFGDIDDIGQVMVNMDRAQVAFQLLVEMRNKALDSYSEIMRMSI